MFGSFGPGLMTNRHNVLNRRLCNQLHSWNQGMGYIFQQDMGFDLFVQFLEMSRHNTQHLHLHKMFAQLLLEMFHLDIQFELRGQMLEHNILHLHLHKQKDLLNQYWNCNCLKSKEFDSVVLFQEMNQHNDHYLQLYNLKNLQSR